MWTASGYLSPGFFSFITDFKRLIKWGKDKRYFNQEQPSAPTNHCPISLILISLDMGWLLQWWEIKMRIERFRAKFKVSKFSSWPALLIPICLWYRMPWGCFGMYQGHFYTDAISRQKENIFKTQTLRISCHLTKNGEKQVFVHILAGERVFLCSGQQTQMCVG